LIANFYPVILAGGRGTRFWPLSRKRRAKQMLALNSQRTMIQETVDRLQALVPASSFWIVTNEDLRAGIARQLGKLNKSQIIAEPVGRNTAPAIGLMAFLLLRRDPNAVIGMFPSDHVITNEARFHKNLKSAVRLALQDGCIVVLGIRPTHPETGYGYIEVGEQLPGNILRVRRFTEKPNPDRAEQFVAAGNYFWNSGMFVWSARTLVNALREHLSETAPYLEKIAAAYGTKKFDSACRELYPRCENISADYALLEPRSAKGEHASNLFCIPAEFGWNDLGSWAALYEHHMADRKAGDNVIEAQKNFILNASGNYIHAPNRFVAAVGVKNLVIVETADALLVTTREHAQDVGKVVQYLDEKKLSKLV
jgi:mannose-1-phosphate guanylyltransferase